MYLKEVRMYNFKSFGEKLVVPMRPGFTAITGPNGSGKSNLGDAILFVLGPRSARKLRAKTLTELIFNGAKAGKPAKECEVSLVFDNTDRMLPFDADEVVLTRRIRRAPKRGEPGNYHSYCYINERAAGIGEFVDLLKHARISAEGYNIVTQGSVNDLVLMTDMDRRRILEEIAGITDFDKDIESADKRRVEVEQNLDRINIILGEIKRALSDLEKERAAAQKYADLTAKQGELKSLFIFKQKDELERQIAETNRQIAEWEVQQKALAAQLEELRTKHHQTLQEQHEVEAQIATFAGPEGEKTKEQIRALQAEAVRLEERINYATDQIKDLNASKAGLAAEHKRVAKEAKELEAQRLRLETQAAEEQAAFEKAEKELRGLRELIGESSQGAMRINADLAKLKVTYEERSADVHKATLERDRLTQRLQAVEELIAQLRENQRTYELEVQDAAFQLKDLNQETKGQAATVKDLEQRHLTLIKKQAQTTQELGEIEEALRRVQREFHELKAVEQASQNAGGFNRAVDAVLEARKKGTLKGIHGTIAELGKVDEKHETALQVAAGPRLMSIVVEDDAAAASAIEYLRSHGLGRAAFLPLNKMIGTNPRGKALLVVKDGASHGFALDLVKFNKKYEAAFSYVFGDTVVMKDLDAARRHMGGVRLVTLQGDLLEAAGAMIGGSLGRQDKVKFAGKDVSKLAELEATIGKHSGHLESLSEALVDLRKQIQAVEAELSTARASENGDMKARDLEARKKEFEAKVEKTRKDLEERDAELTGLQDSVAKLAQRIEKGQAEIDECEKRREELGRLLLKGTKKELADKGTALEAKVNSSRQASLEAASGAQTAAKQHALVSEKVKELEAQLAKGSEQVSVLEKEVQENKRAFQELEERLAAMTKAESQLSGKAQALYDRKEKLAVALKGIEGKMDTVQTKQATQDSLVFQLKSKLPTLEESLGQILVEIQTLRLVEPKEATLTLDEAKKQLAQIDREIAALGPVNQRALQMYEEQMKREGELLGELKRLQEQRENLIQVVEEVTKKKKEGLMVVFEAVNINFKKIYNRLTGGEAYLELENPEKPFEAGLIMKAQPPGKKVQRLQALSGGEKSMTALALIFAIQEYEPSPFYLLDEVDQNLDGINAENAARMMRDNSESAQFVVVSLRKVTLKEAEHIYGVTTAGNGISQMIVNFDFNQITEKGEWVTKDVGGQTLLPPLSASGGPGPAPDASPSKKGAKTISETVKDMVNIEVDK